MMATQLLIDTDVLIDYLRRRLMPDTLVDSNVLLDVLTEDPH
jgi:predicted nucleic-acid-binding protein